MNGLRIDFLPCNLIAKRMHIQSWRWLSCTRDGVQMVWAHRPAYNNELDEWTAAAEVDRCQLPWVVAWLRHGPSLHCIVRANAAGGLDPETPREVSDELSEQELQRLAREVYGRELLW